MTRPPPFRIWHLFSITVTLALFTAGVILLTRHKPETPLSDPAESSIIDQYKIAYVGKVFEIQPYFDGSAYLTVGDEFVQIVGTDGTVDGDKPTRLVLATDLKGTLGHDVMLQGHRRKDRIGDGYIIVADVVLELADEPETVPETTPEK